ncbi:IclR family transcriptional regulator [Pseudogracilibacillus auburnensis]|uniref:IclR family transcriptional regulator n=1 Tax=Pseudogracilibacillus auburnensis TaxID=1494959 RepID=UPI001A975649|nr:IclR family transcriptional regulator [Pseudogracilibacillus auburnensis]MBO1003258.1 IclR family transcriptional regulator [Pseudogracilibacillus auburnensis]
MENNPQVIRSVQRAIDILQCFGKNSEELTLTEISNETGLAKSTTTRLLATLEENNFLEKEVTSGKYRLGRQLYFLGHAAGRSMELKEVSQPAMVRLRDQVKETVNLYVIEGEHRVCIQQFESLQSVKHMIQIGQKLPLTVGASGKVLLAYQPRKFIDDVMEIQRMVKSKSELLTELNQIVMEKYAESIEERELGTSAAAAPVFNINGEVIAALSISGPAQRFNPKKVTDLKTILVASALEISTNMGYTI